MIDWIHDCYEYEYTDWDKYYEAMAEKEDEEWSDGSGKN